MYKPPDVTMKRPVSSFVYLTVNIGSGSQSSSSSSSSSIGSSPRNLIRLIFSSSASSFFWFFFIWNSIILICQYLVSSSTKNDSLTSSFSFSGRFISYTLPFLQATKILVELVFQVKSLIPDSN